MKRRTLGVLAGGSLVALQAGQAKAQTAADPNLLKTTLTPFGAERAANADGSIPAWTGGYTVVPTGFQQPQYVPDPFADEQPTLVINADNMAQHADRLTAGAMAMMQKYGLSINVYPTHRTAAAPQDVYDNTAKNATSASLATSSAGQGAGRFGFQNAIGGIPFPIPDTSDPMTAGAQIIWNHQARWIGRASQQIDYGYVVEGGQLSLSVVAPIKYIFPYYYNTATIDNLESKYHNLQLAQVSEYSAPANLQGEQVIVWLTTNSTQSAWELLAGQGRVRRAPQISFDTPANEADGVINYDEYYAFNGPMTKYDWKYLEKKELYIPYNNNGLMAYSAEEACLEHFLDPKKVRWELHRVWVVEATLHPGERNILARRRFYVDEDTWIIATSDGWDANNNLFHVNLSYWYLRPDLPGLIQSGNTLNNLQNDNWGVFNMYHNEKSNPQLKYFDNIPFSYFDPENMAASAQY